jgi:hypothetical protein
METPFLAIGILVFISGCIGAAVASCIPYRMIDEINERSPADQQIDGFLRISDAMWRRHRELFPDSRKRNMMSLTGIAGLAMMLAGLCLVAAYSSLHELNRNRVVAPRQQETTGTVTAGPLGRHSYSYTFTVGEASYSDWGSIRGPEPTIGQEVLVYYDPQDPTVSALTPFEYSSKERTADLVIGIVILISVATLISVSLIVARGGSKQHPEGR